MAIRTNWDFGKGGVECFPWLLMHPGQLHVSTEKEKLPAFSFDNTPSTLSLLVVGALT